ncbi:hypothetical protein Pint_21842 [Pistacia integerrima]|uniref:Uncharacterized protein n=1 Tax=Pistacia integerrima TaxID=434235 RepID=A0ACC0XCX3_9ROSI|nr:hypothetical protein Pint_21842 [Pistacia integerrima]
MVNRFLMLGRREDGFQVLLSQKKILMSRPVGFIREQSNVIATQPDVFASSYLVFMSATLLHLRHPFAAYITDAMCNELSRVRRPFWWITSSIYAEINVRKLVWFTDNGICEGGCMIYTSGFAYVTCKCSHFCPLLLGFHAELFGCLHVNKQFAVVEHLGFWNWAFTLKDINGEVLSEIDRDRRGFSFEIFTDSGQYVIRFGNADSRSKSGPARVIQELEVARPLTLLDRAVNVALAISLDNDYFFRHGSW